MLPLKPPYNILHFINILLSPNICTFWDTETFLHSHPIFSAVLEAGEVIWGPYIFKNKGGELIETGFYFVVFNSDLKVVVDVMKRFYFYKEWMTLPICVLFESSACGVYIKLRECSPRYLMLWQKCDAKNLEVLCGEFSFSDQKWAGVSNWSFPIQVSCCILSGLVCKISLYPSLSLCLSVSLSLYLYLSVSVSVSVSLSLSLSLSFHCTYSSFWNRFVSWNIRKKKQIQDNLCSSGVEQPKMFWYQIIHVQYVFPNTGTHFANSNWIVSKCFAFLRKSCSTSSPFLLGWQQHCSCCVCLMTHFTLFKVHSDHWQGQSHSWQSFSQTKTEITDCCVKPAVVQSPELKCECTCNRPRKWGTFSNVSVPWLVSGLWKTHAESCCTVLASRTVIQWKQPSSKKQRRSHHMAQTCFNVFCCLRCSHSNRTCVWGRLPGYPYDSGSCFVVQEFSLGLG